MGERLVSAMQYSPRGNFWLVRNIKPEFMVLLRGQVLSSLGGSLGLDNSLLHNLLDHNLGRGGGGSDLKDLSCSQDLLLHVQGSSMCS